MCKDEKEGNIPVCLWQPLGSFGSNFSLHRAHTADFFFSVSSYGLDKRKMVKIGEGGEGGGEAEVLNRFLDHIVLYK